MRPPRPPMPAFTPSARPAAAQTRDARAGGTHTGRSAAGTDAIAPDADAAPPSSGDPDPPEIASMIDDLIAREGGLSEHPDDRGGVTKYGITRATLAAWRGAPVAAADVRALSRDEARRIYRARFLEEPGIARLPASLRAPLFDAAVLHGPPRAVRMFQKVLRDCGEAPGGIDGRIGPRTTAAAVRAEKRWGRRIAASLAEERRRLIYRLVRKEPRQAVFADGWLARIDRLDPFSRYAGPHAVDRGRR